MSNYPWLNERKSQATAERSKKSNDLPSPVHAGRDISYTGKGSPDSVAEYTPDGQPIHKGELKFGNPGDQVITDAMSSRELMSNPVIAQKLNGYKCGGYGGRKGYQDGGVNSPTGESVDPVGNPIGVNLPSTPESAIPTTTPNIAAPNTDAQVKPTVDSEALREKGLSAIGNILDTGSTAGRVAGNKQISDLKSTQDLERQVQKQEIAQKGLGDSQASGQMARLTAQHQGALSETESNVAIEKLQSQERAAGRLASEGKVQTDIEIAKSVQGLNEAQFGEFVRQFEVGTDQWDTAFDERRRQFEVGTDQWDTSFDEQRRQFEVGSEQWNDSFKEQREQSQQNFDEQKRQFDVGSDQWETANEQQQDRWKASFDEQRKQFDVGTEQWDKSFDEERRQYDNEDDRWWNSFNEQRREFNVGSNQWQDSFEQQKHQFDVGSDQWNEAHALQVKEFAQNVDMDKHSVDVWKDNVEHRDKAYLDTLTMEQQRLEMEQAVHAKNMEVLDYQLDTTKQNDQTKKYWEDSQRVHNYAATHLDGFDEKTGKFTGDAENEMFQWFKTKYPGSPADIYTDPAVYAEHDPEKYAQFQSWAAGEWKAATDNRLTNPYDKMLYDVESSSLDDKSKKIVTDFLSSPEALASITGINIDSQTGNVAVVTSDGSVIPAIPGNLGGKNPDLLQGGGGGGGGGGGIRP